MDEFNQDDTDQFSQQRTSVHVQSIPCLRVLACYNINPHKWALVWTFSPIWQMTGWTFWRCLHTGISFNMNAGPKEALWRIKMSSRGSGCRHSRILAIVLKIYVNCTWHNHKDPKGCHNAHLRHSEHIRRQLDSAKTRGRWVAAAIHHGSSKHMCLWHLENYIIAQILVHEKNHIKIGSTNSIAHQRINESNKQFWNTENVTDASENKGYRVKFFSMLLWTKSSTHDNFKGIEILWLSAKGE